MGSQLVNRLIIVGILNGMALQFVAAQAPTSLPASDSRPTEAVLGYIGAFDTWARGDARSTEQMLSQLSRQFPDDMPLAFFYAVCNRTRWGDENRAAFERIALQAPDSAQGQCSAILGRIRTSPDPAKDFTLLQKLSEATPDEPLVAWMFVLEAYRLKKYEPALATIEKIATTLNPGPPHLYRVWGDCLDMLNRHQEALPHRMTALKLESAGWSNGGVAYTLSRLRRYAEATDYYAKAVAINPAAEHLRAWGIALYNLRKYQEAIEKLERASRTDPKDSNTWYYWARCLEELNQWDEALIQFAKSRELDPANYYSFRNSVALLRSLGRTAEAQKIADDWKSRMGKTLEESAPK